MFPYVPSYYSINSRIILLFATTQWPSVAAHTEVLTYLESFKEPPWNTPKSGLVR